jgi:hypothetical protein
MACGGHCNGNQSSNPDGGYNHRGLCTRLCGGCCNPEGNPKDEQVRRHWGIMAENPDSEMCDCTYGDHLECYAVKCTEARNVLQGKLSDKEKEFWLLASEHGELQKAHARLRQEFNVMGQAFCIFKSITNRLFPGTVLPVFEQTAILNTDQKGVFNFMSIEKLDTSFQTHVEHQVRSIIPPLRRQGKINPSIV